MTDTQAYETAGSSFDGDDPVPWDGLRRRSGRIAALYREADEFARLCAQAINDGDSATALGWASEYELTLGKADLLTRLDYLPDTGGDRP